jgi:hypothetical protein
MDGMSVEDQLERAADYMQAHGWTRGTYEHRGRVCLLGALTIGIKRAQGWTIDTIAAQDHLRLYLMTTYHRSVVGFNDDECRSKRQAVQTLREAAHWQPPQEHAA